MVMGDFNETESQGAHFPLWSRYGWRNAQTFASERFHWTPCNTSKGAREVDMVWLSPEALALMRAIEVHDVFADHSTGMVGLDFDQHCSTVLTWPQPSAIPWAQVQDTWDPTPFASSGEDSTEWFQHWSAHFESSLDGFVKGQPALKLTPQQRGRGNRTHPVTKNVTPPLAKPSREGELSLRSDLAGSCVRQWFKQLRRFQSLLRSMRADNIGVNACIYRAEVWAAIRRARGFEPNFALWWYKSRQFDHPDAPSFLPFALPSLVELEGIFRSFKSCFESFESWHILQRTKLLRAKHEHTMDSLHVELRDSCKEQVDSFVIPTEHNVVAVDDESNQIALEKAIDTRGFSTWSLDGAPCSPTDIDQNVCSLEIDGRPEVHDVLTQTQHLTQTADIHDAC